MHVLMVLVVLHVYPMVVVFSFQVQKVASSTASCISDSPFQNIPGTELTPVGYFEREDGRASPKAVPRPDATYRVSTRI